ncbi:TetR/AcrR family transcriptional regulator [Rhodococcus aetherivorans]
MPRISKEAKQLNRRKILDTASVMFREQGTDQVGIDQIMNSVGLTRGGFYNHFESKESLIGEACRSAFTATLDELKQFLAQTPDTPTTLSPLERFAERYLSKYHRDVLSEACPAPAMGADISRHTATAQQPYAEGVQSYLQIVAALLSPQPVENARGNLNEDQNDPEGRSSPAARGSAASIDNFRQPALEAFVSMVGAMVLARAVRAADPALSEELLGAGRHSVAGIVSSITVAEQM